MIEYNIGYVLEFFLEFFKHLNLNFLNFKQEKLKTGSPELELHFKFPHYDPYFHMICIR
jgi:hypothetical protein